MANLQHLIAALGKVADAYAPYAPDPNDDPDASDKDPEDDPGNDEGDPLDDPRSYTPDDDEADKENAEDKDGTDEDDFSKPKVFSTVMLLQRLESEAEQKYYEKRRLTAKQLRIKAAPTKLQQKSEKLMEMRRKAAAIEHELKLNQEMEVQSKRLQKANLELYRANKTTKDRIELEVDIERMASWASQYCKEAGTDWREQATAAFQNKKL
jgi:hypothetical protein